MRCKPLFEGVPILQPEILPDFDVLGVQYNSRQLRAGEIFAAIQGERTDGHRYLEQAVTQGARAIVSERSRPEGFPLPWIQVPNIRAALARAAANLFHHPSQSLSLIGITGTNGKTSTAFLVEAVLKTAGESVGVISTIEYRGPGWSRPATHTTPESLDLQAILATLVEQQCRFAIMEVSSHALALERVHACLFRTAVFTNLTPEHLDFHQNLDQYFNAKKKLFLDCGMGIPGQSLINLDDPRGRELKDITAGRSLSYALDCEADYRLASSEFRESRTLLKFATPYGELQLKPRLIGRPNFSNLLAAAAVTLELGISMEMVQAGLNACPPIPGRFENVECGQPFRVIVDYAHTPDALEKIIQTARDLKPRRVLTLFGCGGERDRLKRPIMGRVAQAGSDWISVTSDNPRGEDPLAIIAEIVTGFDKKMANYQIEPNRGKAIRDLLGQAEPGDIVILAGKGHETYQIVAGEIHHFDDREQARLVLREMDYDSLESGGD
jgi:UDP-N-acetylmuramoyl-L-alanyl-D-glutamate--2,6-diaminopimelate ligase